MWNAIPVQGLIPLQGLRSAAGSRLGIGIVQGVALCLLYGAAETTAWPASNGLIFTPLLLVACFVPIIVITGLGNLRPRTLTAWAIAASALLAGLAAHDISRGADTDGWFLWHLLGGEHLHIWPSHTLVLFTAVALFIAQSLIVAGDGDLSFIAVYPLYFDAAWRLAVQAALSAAFVGLFWLLLSLGAGLFKLIGVAFFSELIERRWFALPATTLAFACALHVTDTHAGIMRGLRGLILVLLAWFMPLVTLFVAGFLATLPLTGLAPLWGTHFATGLLLATTAALVVLINATYHDGLPEHKPPLVLRRAGRIAALMLVPLVAIAAYALAVRVGQYGWTSDRIIAAACVMVAGCYALGYTVAAIGRGAWLRRIEACNIATAFVVLAVFFALFTPLADPARLAVLDQLARLDSGVVPPEKFDFDYLRFEGARYGAATLERLKSREQGPDAATIRRRAQAASNTQYRGSAQLVAPTPEDLAAHITVYPRGRALPESFQQQDWSRFKSWDLPRCLADSSADCDAFLVDLNRNGRDEIILDDHAQMIVMTADAQGRWSRVGRLAGPSQCKELKEALRAGKFGAAAPRWSDLKVGEMRLELAQPFATIGCP